MSFVHILDDNTINKIAAGEVVERPASVIKELVENAIDAKADRIEVEMTAGGTSYMRVSDNGIGMSREDAQMAILRHATSKIVEVDDLQSIDTLGFRGEALPSIASVSRFSLLTRQAGAELGTEIKISGGREPEIGEAGCSLGTTIKVEDLFFNTPARKKFLKTTNTEASKITEFIIKLAISNPQIAFKLIANNKTSVVTPGNGDLKDTLGSIYGQTVSQALLPLDFEDQDISIHGYISKPSTIRSSRSWQSFIVNGRIISNRAIAKAIDNAYHALIPRSGYPLIALNIQVPQHTIDVNVHPQKSEMKFEDEGRIFKAVYKAVLDAVRPQGQQLGSVAAGVASHEVQRHVQNSMEGMAQTRQGGSGFLSSLQPKAGNVFASVERPKDYGQMATLIDIPREPVVKPPLQSSGLMEMRRQQLAEQKAGLDKVQAESSIPAAAYQQKLAEQAKAAMNYAQPAHPQNIVHEAPAVDNEPVDYVEKTVHDVHKNVDNIATSRAETAVYPQNTVDNLQQEACPQRTEEKEPQQDDVSAEEAAVAEKAISPLVPIGQVDNTYIIAQDADGLYIVDQHAAHERILFDRFSAQAEHIPSQQLLVHLLLDFSSREAKLIEEQLELFQSLGFGLEPSGPEQFRLTEVPADIPVNEAEALIREILVDMEELHRPSAAELRKRALATTACKAAIKAGFPLNFRQMEVILEELHATAMPYTCPHGRPTILKFSSAELAKMFKRTGF